MNGDYDYLNIFGKLLFRKKIRTKAEYKLLMKKIESNTDILWSDGDNPTSNSLLNEISSFPIKVFIFEDKYDPRRKFLMYDDEL